MTVMPCSSPAPSTTSATPGASAEPGATPTDFMAAFLAAMTDNTAPTTAPAVEEGAQAPGAKPGEELALTVPTLIEEGAPAPASKSGEDVEPTEPQAIIDPALAALLAQQVPVVAPGLETVAAQPPQPTATERIAGAAAPNAAQATANTPEPAVAGKAATTKEPVSVPAEVASSSAPVSTLPATAIQPAGPQPAAPTAVTAPVTAPVANTGPLDRVSAQVFPEVTGLVSRGNGTHRITMTLNPEQLGEVRIVMTVRDGAVHVRMAAGHEASAALLNGSAELSRLLEATGATEARVVVRDLPAAAVGAAPDTHPNNGSLDQHAGTRADHQAKDGSDQNTPGPDRVPGATSTGPTPRSIQSVIRTRAAGLDLTM